MITGFTFSLVIAVAVVGCVPSPSARREQFDLEDLMNKFLTEYDTKATEPQHQPVAQQENIDFAPEPESYFPDAIEEQSYYSEPQEYYQEPQDQSSFYPEPHHHEMEQQHQHLHKHPNQAPHQHPHHPHPHKQQQQQQEMSGYNRYKDSPSSEQSSGQQKQTAPSGESRQPQPSAGESQEEQESLDPKLRDFTLIISKLLFQLSQL